MILPFLRFVFSLFCSFFQRPARRNSREHTAMHRLFRGRKQTVYCISCSPLYTRFFRCTAACCNQSQLQRSHSPSRTLESHQPPQAGSESSPSHCLRLNTANQGAAGRKGPKTTCCRRRWRREPGVRNATLGMPSAAGLAGRGGGGRVRASEAIGGGK